MAHRTPTTAEQRVGALDGVDEHVERQTSTRHRHDGAHGAHHAHLGGDRPHGHPAVQSPTERDTLSEHWQLLTVLDEQHPTIAASAELAAAGRDPVSGATPGLVIPPPALPAVQEDHPYAKHVLAARWAGSNGGRPRPVSVVGPPGSSIADVAVRAATLTLLGYPPQIQQEVVDVEILANLAIRMRGEHEQTRQLCDPELIAAAMDTVVRIAVARGMITPEGGDTGAAREGLL